MWLLYLLLLCNQIIIITRVNQDDKRHHFNGEVYKKKNPY
jgi:hypothetical protein